MSKGIKDPVDQQPDWKHIVACYIMFVMIGVIYKNKATLTSITCKGCAGYVAKLVTIRDSPSQVDFEDGTNWTRITIVNLEKEEDIAS